MNPKLINRSIKIGTHTIGNAKEELRKFKDFTMQKYNLQKKKNPLKETKKIVQDIITL
jgi:hypothetical protein